MLASITQNGANGIGKALMAEPRGPRRVRSLTRLYFSVTGVIRYRVSQRALFRDHWRRFVLHNIYNDISYITIIFYFIELNYCLLRN